MRFRTPPPRTLSDFGPDALIRRFLVLRLRALCFSILPCAFRLYLVRFFDSPRAFSILRVLRQRISALFHSTLPHFLSLPAVRRTTRSATDTLPPLFSRTPGARFALPQKKNPSTALFIMLSMDSLFTTGPSWYRLRLIYIMVWRERGNRPYRRHVSPRTVPAVPYLKGTPPWNTRKHPSLFFAKRGRRKSMHSVIRTPQLLLRTAPASFHTAQPIQSIAPFLCHLHPDCPTKPKKKHTT